MPKYSTRLDLPNDVLNHADLTVEEERRLAETGHTDELVRYNAKMVASLVVEYDESKLDGMDANDLFQFGMEGVAYAATKWDPSFGYRFTSYARQMARNFINTGIVDHGREIRLPTGMWRRHVSLLDAGIPCERCKDSGYHYQFRPDLDELWGSEAPDDPHYYCPQGHRLDDGQVKLWLSAARSTTQSATTEMAERQAEDWEPDEVFDRDPTQDPERSQDIHAKLLGEDRLARKEQQRQHAQRAVYESIIELPMEERDFMIVFSEISLPMIRSHVPAELIPSDVIEIGEDPIRDSLKLSEKSNDGRKAQVAEYLGLQHWVGEDVYQSAVENLKTALTERLGLEDADESVIRHRAELLAGNLGVVE